MDSSYKHTSMGVAFFVQVFVIAALASGVLLALSPELLGRIAPVIGVVAGLLLVLFYSLTVEVEPETLVLRFGLGLIQKRIVRADIVSIKVVESPWYHGYGIRGIPSGWLYNVSGAGAVELTLKAGGVIRVGTTDPPALERALSAAA